MGACGSLALPLLTICFALGACGTPPPVFYQAQFPPERMQEAQEIVQEVAGSWGLRRQDAGHLTAVARDRGWMYGFSMAYDRPGGAQIVAGGGLARRRSVLRVGNGVMTVLTISAYEGPGLSASEAELLAKELKDALESRLAIEFCRGREVRYVGGCEARPTPRLLYLADADPFRHAADREWVSSLRTALRGSEAAVDYRGYWVTDRHVKQRDGREGDFPLLVAYDERARRRGEDTLALAEGPDGALALAVYDQGGMPLAEADALARTAKRELAERVGLSLCRADPATGACDERHARLEAEREAWLSVRETNRAEDVEAFLAERPGSPHAAEARERLARLRALAAPQPPAPPAAPARWRGRQPGETFADPLDTGGAGPKLIVVPGGAFRMGCVSGVVCQESERPVREVRFARPFALARSETTYADYQRFAKPDLPAQAHWAQSPAVHLTWREASAYAEWLSERTGERYRLPSEAEWERAARAGLETAFVWGDELDPDQDARRRRGRTARCRQCPGEWGDWLFWNASVGAYPPNAWGFFEMAGNAAEWTADCWQEDHLRAPADGAARTDGDCSRRTVRGGSHAQTVLWARPAARAGRPADRRYLDVGFRVLRELRDGE